MDIEFRPSAFRHGISEERIRYVIARCPSPLYAPWTAHEEQDLVWFLGPDRNGVELEVLLVEQGADGFMVIHAMKLNSKWRRDYERVMGWPRRSR